MTAPKYYISAEWDAAIDLAMRRVVYGTLAGGAVAAVLFRGPSTRAAVTALGTGFGLGSAYQQSSETFDRLFKSVPKPGAESRP